MNTVDLLVYSCSLVLWLCWLEGSLRVCVARTVKGSRPVLPTLYIFISTIYLISNYLLCRGWSRWSSGFWKTRS